MVRVLMFGWEFPPHISGGLGTACHGLTTALANGGVKVTFVVPKLSGDEACNGATLISASEIELRNDGKPIRRVRRVTSSQSTLAGRNVPAGMFETIEVPSTLSPYNYAHLGAPTTDLEDWKGQLFSQTASDMPEGGKTPSANKYEFQGGYGQHLIDEVDRFAEVAREIARKEDFDVIHAHDWMTFPAGLAAKEVSGKPLIIHVHATEYDRASTWGNPLVHEIEKEGIQESDRIVGVSNWTRQTLIKHYGAEPSKVHVVHNGILETRRTEPRRFKHPMGHQMITFLGRVTFQKGPEYFVDAAEKVLQQFPSTHFVMAGSGDALPQIIARVARKKMSSQFHFTGFLKKNDIDKLLDMTRVYVMPSVSEPFGITPLEAIQAGVPVIISRQSGVAEVMPHAITTDYWDTEALSQAICGILRYKSLGNTLRDNSMARIKTITWEEAAKKVKQLYYETLSATYN